MQHRKLSWSWTLFAFIFLTEFAVGYYIAHVLGYMHSDAMSRVANAFYVLYSRDPHLGAIGFVWNPLPSLLEIVPLLIYPLYHPVASSGLASVLLTSLFAGLTATHLFRAGRKFELSVSMSATIALLYALNPFMFLFGANGLSDVPYMFFIIATITHFCLWIRNEEVGDLILASFALSLAFWTRYEAVPFGFALAVSIPFIVFFWRKGSSYSLIEKWRKAEATIVLAILPIFFFGLLWIFFNYTIMGNPLFFLNSEYSNESAAAVLREDENFRELFSSPINMLKLIAEKTVWYSAPLFSILIVRILTRRLFRWDILVLILLFLAVPGLQFLLLLRQSSFGFFRYFMYVLPVVVAWIPYELNQVAKRMRRVCFSIICCGLLAAAGMLSYALTNPNIAPDEHNFLTITKGNLNYQRQQLEVEISQWIDDNITGTVLTDSASAYVILVNSHHPRRYLITSDYDFRSALENPLEHDVQYILVPKPMRNVQSTVNTAYPSLYEEGTEWTELERDFDDIWRLYKIKKQPLTDTALGATP